MKLSYSEAERRAYADGDNDKAEALAAAAELEVERDELDEQLDSAVGLISNLQSLVLNLGETLRESGHDDLGSTLMDVGEESHVDPRSVKTNLRSLNDRIEQINLPTKLDPINQHKADKLWSALSEMLDFAKFGPIPIEEQQRFRAVLDNNA